MQKSHPILTVHVFFLLIIFYSCSNNNNDENNSNPTYFEANYGMNSLVVDTSLYFAATTPGRLTNPQIDEASGMAISRQDTTLIWTHNDSGDFNRIFLLKNDGTYMGTFRVVGAENRDWEDMASGPGPVEGKNYLYVADIGDNNAQYNIKYIYRFPEPDITTADSNLQYIAHNIDVNKISFQYPDNIRMDAETIMIDPLTKDIYIVTKREFPVVVYRLPYPQSTTATMVAQKVVTLPFTWATAGDISSDGKKIILKTKEEVFLWTRNESESVAVAFLKAPLRVPYTPEPQGEAIAFMPGGSGYYTLSEAKDNIVPVIYFYRRK